MVEHRSFAMCDFFFQVEQLDQEPTKLILKCIYSLERVEC
jgi:hypothetical protein